MYKGFLVQELTLFESLLQKCTKNLIYVLSTELALNLSTGTHTRSLVQELSLTF